MFPLDQEFSRFVYLVWGIFRAFFPWIRNFQELFPFIVNFQNLFPLNWEFSGLVPLGSGIFRTCLQAVLGCRKLGAKSFLGCISQSSSQFLPVSCWMLPLLLRDTGKGTLWCPQWNYFYFSIAVGWINKLEPSQEVIVALREALMWENTKHFSFFWVFFSHLQRMK